MTPRKKTQKPKSEPANRRWPNRLQFYVDGPQNEMVRKAANIESKELSAFMREIVVKACKQIIADNGVILSHDDRRTLPEAQERTA